MKLYLTRLAVNPERVLMFMAEKGLTWERAGITPVELSLVGLEHKTPDFLKVSPLAQVPALEFPDGRVLTESRAICQWLEGRFPEPSLTGETAEERAFIEMWDRRMEFSLLVPLAMWVRHGHPALGAMENPQLPEWAEVNRERLERIVGWLDTRLTEVPFVAGERFSIADITAYAALQFGRLMKYRPWETHAGIARWRAVMQARPAGQGMVFPA
jgi:glutathione S-transferase